MIDVIQMYVRLHYRVDVLRIISEQSRRIRNSYKFDNHEFTTGHNLYSHFNAVCSFSENPIFVIKGIFAIKKLDFFSLEYAV